jgi:hypothetical protein
MSNEQMKIMEFLVQYEREKWNNGKWKLSVSQIIQHMKNTFDWKEQYTQGVLSEMTSNGMLGEIK